MKGIYILRNLVVIRDGLLSFISPASDVLALQGCLRCWVECRYLGTSLGLWNVGGGMLCIAGSGKSNPMMSKYAAYICTWTNSNKPVRSRHMTHSRRNHNWKTRSNFG